MKKIYISLFIFLAICCSDDIKTFPHIEKILLIRNSNNPSMDFYTADTIDIRLFASDIKGDMQKLIVNTYQDTGSNFEDSQYINTEELALPAGSSIEFNSTSPFRTASTIENYFLEFYVVDAKGYQSLSYVTSYAVVDEPLIDSSTFDQNFGGVSIPDQSLATITISNIGTAGDIRTSQLVISGIDADQFTLSNDNCSQKTILPLGSETVDVIFRPTSLGLKSASLDIPYNHLDTPTLSIPLAGTGTSI